VTVSYNQINSSAAYGVFCYGGCSTYGGTIVGNTYDDNGLANTN